MFLLSRSGVLRSLGIAVLAVAACARPGPESFRVSVEESGVYRVSWEALAAAGLTGEPDSARLGVSHRGVPVPIWVEDGGDGRFGPGDHVELVGERLTGELGWFDPYSDRNVYRLDVGAAEPARMVGPAVACERGTNSFTARLHLERDELRARFAEGAEQDVWFWERISYADDEPLSIRLELADLDTASTQPVSVRLRLRGWSRMSRATRTLPDHRVEVLFDGEQIAAEEWDNRPEGLVLELPGLPASAFAADGQGAGAPAGELALRVPVRLPEGLPLAPDEPLIDAVLVDWLEVEYPRTGRLETAAELLRDPLGAGDPGCVELDTEPGRRVTVYGPGGARAESGPGERHRLAAGTAAGPLRAVLDDALLEPAAVEPWRGDALTGGDHRADYLIVADPTLVDAVEPLAELHRERGLAVEVIPVDAVYDAFNDGIVHPRAIRDLIAAAFHGWRPPAPRFVLLVGDASWDPRAEATSQRRYADWTYRPGRGPSDGGFRRNRSTPYEQGPRGARRDLIPTWEEPTREGLAASDNPFVSVDGDDDLPDLAIGRWPVTEPGEVAAIVDKTVRYISGGAPASSRVLLLHDGSAGLEKAGEELAESLADRGFEGVQIDPDLGAGEAEGNRDRVLAALAREPLLVHFAGHGGRYIWRTARVDLERAQDLFTLDDLDRLPPAERPSIVLSMTCYSAPFDHPQADSIGEKFLRLPDRGAVAVIAASWRNNPSPLLSEALLTELTRPGTTVGEALMRVKRETPNVYFRQQYNLLGDPALPVPVPDGIEPPRPVGASGPRGETAQAGGGAEKGAGNGDELPPLANVISWSTASEVDNFGFDVYRADAEDGPFVRLSEDIIRGAGTSDMPSEYRFVDDGIEPEREYFYYVESVSLAGERERFTPVIRAPAKPASPETPAEAPADG